MSNKKMPGLVKAISILYYFLAASTFLYLLFPQPIKGVAYSITSMFNFLGALLSNVVFVWSFYVLVHFAMITFLYFVARALWKGRNWARITVIVISTLSFAIPAWIMVAGFPWSIMLIAERGILPFLPFLFGPIINVFIAAYLLFNKQVKEAFTQSKLG